MWRISRKSSGRGCDLQPISIPRWRCYTNNNSARSPGKFAGDQWPVVMYFAFAVCRKSQCDQAELSDLLSHICRAERAEVSLGGYSPPEGVHRRAGDAATRLMNTDSLVLKRSEFGFVLCAESHSRQNRTRQCQTNSVRYSVPANPQMPLF